MWNAILEFLLIGVGLLLVAGTAAGRSTHPHWLIRSWDFPRAQIAVALVVIGGCYGLLYFEGGWLQWLFLGAMLIALVWQCAHIVPYTPLAPKHVQPHRLPRGPQSLRMVMSNVEMDNPQCDRWLEVVRAQDPDLILAVEVNQRWIQDIGELREDYPYRVEQPQDNCYGMAVFSKLKLIDPQVRFLVQDDIPSIHTQVELRSGERVMFHGLHPRPPEPVRDQDSKPRDAELVIVGRMIHEEKERLPAIVAGDLNDVAWSRTTRLFLHLSGMLDPRKGRGFYNSFHARHWLLRFPLDHVFHTDDFRLVELRLLENVGSDHFPVCVELSHEPDAELTQDEPEPDSNDEAEAQEKLDRQRTDD